MPDIMGRSPGQLLRFTLSRIAAVKTLSTCGVLPFVAGADTIATGPYTCQFNGLNWEDAYNGDDASNYLLTSGFICARAYGKVTMTLTP